MKKSCCICRSQNKICHTDIGYLCGKHYLQYKRHGKCTRTKYDPNEFIKENNIIKIYLYDKNGNKINEAIIDVDKYDLVKNYKWCIDCNGYVKNSGQEYLHRLIIGAKDLFVDHINGNKLDNRLSNLRLCTNSENVKNHVKLNKNNTSGIIGVRYRNDRHKWYAEIQCDNKVIRLGSFSKKEDAIKARINAEIVYFKEFKSKVLNNEIN